MNQDIDPRINAAQVKLPTVVKILLVIKEIPPMANSWLTFRLCEGKFGLHF